MLFENNGVRIRTLMEAGPEVTREAIKAFIAMLRLPESLRPFREITVEYCNGVRPTESPLGDILRSLGFMRDRNQTLRIDIFT